MKRQYQHKKRDASDAMRESNGARKKAGMARKSRGALVVDDAAASPLGFTAGEVETLSGLVTSAMSSLSAVRTILERRPLKRRQSE